MSGSSFSAQAISCNLAVKKSWPICNKYSCAIMKFSSLFQKGRWRNGEQDKGLESLLLQKGEGNFANCLGPFTTLYLLHILSLRLC